MKKLKIKDLCIMAISLAIIIVASKINIQIGPIPLTLQTFSVFIVSLLLGSFKAFIVFLVYIILGLIGIPVFSSGGGIAYIYMPSFGFIIGFLLSAPIIGIASKSNKFYLKYILSMVGLLIINVCGVSYMYIIFNYYKGVNKDLLNILQIGVLPFIIKDIFTVILSCIIYSRLKVIIYKEEKEEPKLFNERVN
jgi:biotin transport system substrate-specific component